MSFSNRRPSADTKRSLFDAFQFIEAFREMRPEMPMHMASAFLLIAMKPGITQRELLTLSEIAQATMSRNIAALTERDRHGKPGMNLVIQRRDPMDARTLMLFLTKDGYDLVSRLIGDTISQSETVGT